MPFRSTEIVFFGQIGIVVVVFFVLDSRWAASGGNVVRS